jgi:hypothetical protein
VESEKSTLCAMFANYLTKEKNAGTVCIMDCDRQHSMVAKRQADAKYLQAENVPYEFEEHRDRHAPVGSSTDEVCEGYGRHLYV